MQTVHVRVTDAATGQPTPCRVRFTDAAGVYYPPLGRLAHLRPTIVGYHAEGNIFVGNDAWCYIDGSCEIPLPPGTIHVQIRKGLEYTPIDTTVELAAGKLAMRFVLERWTDSRKNGWYSGDSRVHLNSPHEHLLAAAAEDLAVVNLLVTEYSVPGPAGRLVLTFPNIVAFSGQSPCLEVPGHMVVVNTHNVHPYLGSLGLLHCHRIVFPLSPSADEVDSWTLADWCDQCHRKAGLVVWTLDDKQCHRLDNECLAAAILGKIDAFEMDWTDINEFCEPVLGAWYLLLNAGLRLPLIGGSGSALNRAPIPGPRTYAQLKPAEPFTYRNWIEAVRAGRTYVTCGPLLDFALEGSVVRAEVRSQVPVARLEVVLNGQVIAASQDHRIVQEVAATDGGWLALRCWDTQSRLLAHTSPVYVEGGGAMLAVRQKARQELASHLAKFMGWAERNAPGNTRLQQVLHNAAAKMPQ